jgi:hypothetical protein
MRTVAAAVEAALRAVRPAFPERAIIPAARMIAHWLTDSDPMSEGTPDWLPGSVLEDIGRRLSAARH